MAGSLELGQYGGASRVFDDPFMLYSSESMPSDLQSALDVCLYLYFLNPQYRAASSRVRRHFITDFDYPKAGSSDEKSDFDDYLHYKLKLPSFLAEVGDEEAAYGNTFCRIHFPFDRFLIDPRNHKSYSLDMFGSKARYDYRKMVYTVPDPIRPGSQISLRFRDIPSRDSSRIKLCRINPRYVTIRHCPISLTSRYVYRFESWLTDDVKRGRLHVVNTIPMSMLSAICNNQDFLFDEDAIYHYKAPTISGVSNYGWGIPGTIANYRNIWQIQVYRKIDEAVGLDYLLPFRLFSPSDKVGTNAFIENSLMSRWSDQMAELIRNRRKDKFAIHSLPFPVTYQEMGAEGKTLTPKELLEYQTGALLDGMGYPQELFKGSLAYLQTPTALRLFESSFLYIYIGFNDLSRWVVKKVRNYLGQPPMEIMLQRPTIADSLERKQLLFQLASMGEISRETAYDSLGIDDVAAEMKKRLDEDAEMEKEKAKKQQELQKELESGSTASEGGDAAQSGGEGGAAPVTPGDMATDADNLAGYWLSIPSQGERSKAMSSVRVQNEQLYALAKNKMEQMRNQGASQGRQMVNAQAQQGGPPQ